MNSDHQSSLNEFDSNKSNQTSYKEYKMHSSSQVINRTRSFSAADSQQFQNLKIENPHSVRFDPSNEPIPGTNTPNIPSKSRKRALSDTELGELVDILKDYQDFTPLKDKHDIISIKLKRAKVMQKEIANLASGMDSVKIEKDDSMAL